MGQTERPLDGVRVGIFIAPAGTEEVEFTEPRRAVSDAVADGLVTSRYPDDMDAFTEAIIDAFAENAR